LQRHFRTLHLAGRIFALKGSKAREIRTKEAITRNSVPGGAKRGVTYLPWAKYSGLQCIFPAVGLSIRRKRRTPTLRPFPSQEEGNSHTPSKGRDVLRMPVG